MVSAHGAAIFAAVEIVQSRSARAHSVFWGDVFDRAADILLTKLAKPAATTIPDPNTLAENAVADAKKVVRSRQAKRETDAESGVAILAAPDATSAADVEVVDSRLDLPILLNYASPRERDVLMRRLAGTPDEEIADTLGIALGSVWSLATRGVARIRTKVADGLGLAS